MDIMSRLRTIGRAIGLIRRDRTTESASPVLDQSAQATLEDRGDRERIMARNSNFL